MKSLVRTKYACQIIMVSKVFQWDLAVSARALCFRNRDHSFKHPLQTRHNRSVSVSDYEYSLPGTTASISR